MMPAPQYYDPDSMSGAEREEFYRWYIEAAPGYVFNFRAEVEKYCRADVEILRRSCLAFQKIFLNVGKICPLSEAVTIASACSKVYRKNFLTPKTIGIVPPGGYRRADQHSQQSIEWLLHCERSLGRQIIHAARAREIRLPEGFKVDGFLPPMNASEGRGQVFEYHGCYFHGCIWCFDKLRDKKLSIGRSFNTAYEETQLKSARIRAHGYVLHEIWECQFNKVKREHPEIVEYVRGHPLMSRVTLNPRDSFFGGRTENFIPYYKVEKGKQQIKYTDLCSQYPDACKNGEFPYDHPTIYVGSQCNFLTGGDNDNLKNVQGLVKCRVLPPRDLYLPLLPVKMNGRLLFALCRSCCEESRASDCVHENPAEREFEGVWVSLELRKAVELGYRITEIYVIWQYKMTRFDGEKGGLFAQYINTFLKIKQEASGWPSWCTDEESKTRYLREYEEGEGIRLDREKIEKNAGLRAVAKLCLNSFWGKFGQRSNLLQTDIVKSREALLKILTCPEKETMSILTVNDEILYVNWRFREEAVTSAPHTNVVLAAFTTAQARLKLYSYMEKLERRLLYCDTDSCIFVKNVDDPTEYEPKLGSLLGEMTDELQSYPAGSFIETMIAPAPKFYAFRVLAPDNQTFECCKAKGVRLNFKNSSRINFESIKTLIDGAFENEDREIKLNFRAIQRTKTRQVITRDDVKTCSAVMKKRRYISQSLSLPFGYKN